MKSVTLQLTEFRNLDDRIITYGYRIYDSDHTDYNNTFSTKKEVRDLINKDTVFDFVKSNHKYFWGVVKAEGGLMFNDDIVTLEDYKERKYHTDDSEVDDEVEKIISDAAELILPLGL